MCVIVACIGYVLVACIGCECLYTNTPMCLHKALRGLYVYLVLQSNVYICRGEQSICIFVNYRVSDTLSVKVADFGLSRDIYSKDYYHMGSKTPLPVKWMAPESLKENIFTEKSDVVSLTCCT